MSCKTTGVAGTLLDMTASLEPGIMGVPALGRRRKKITYAHPRFFPDRSCFVKKLRCHDISRRCSGVKRMAKFYQAHAVF